MGKALWFGPLQPLQGLFFHTPLVHAFVLASTLYHDHYRWPLRDRPRFERWKSETAWGRLFADYERAAAGFHGRRRLAMEGELHV